MVTVRTPKAPSSATVSWDTLSRRDPQAALTLMSVRSGLITVTCTRPVSMFLEVSNAAAEMAGSGMASSVLMRMSAQQRTTTVTSTQTVSTHQARTGAHVKKASMEMDFHALTWMSVQTM